MIKLVPVAWPWQAEHMRRIRNTCRDFMTHDRSHIGPIRQLIWFFTYYMWHPGTFQAYLLTMYGVPVGYGIVSRRSEGWTVSGGIVPAFRGMSIGKVLFSFLTGAAFFNSFRDIAYRGTLDTDRAEVRLDLLSSNIPALKLYESLGYERIAASDDMIWMHWQRPV